MTDAPTPSPSPKPSFKRSLSLMQSISSPEGHPVRTLWLGVVLLLISFGFKQVMIDFSLFNAGSMLNESKLELDQRAEISNVMASLDSKDDEIDKLRSEAPEPPEDGSGYDAYRKQLDDHRKKMKELRDARSKAQKDLQPQLDKIRDEYRPMIREARRDQASSQSTALGMVQKTLWLKLILDLMKLAGAILVILSALTISFDPNRDTGSKAYAIVLGGVAFLVVIMGGVISLLG